MPHRIEPLNLPFGFAFYTNFMLADPRSTSDHLLLSADAADELAKALPPGSHFTPALIQASAKLREWAPLYAQPRGRKHGDFDGTLSA